MITALIIAGADGRPLGQIRDRQYAVTGCKASADPE
jgi:hypothetical protein